MRADGLRRKGTDGRAAYEEALAELERLTDDRTAKSETVLVAQVYGWLLCPVTGRVLIQEQHDGTFSLPGGAPEPFDADRHRSAQNGRDLPCQVSMLKFQRLFSRPVTDISPLAI